jgi:hypothetical protein
MIIRCMEAGTAEIPRPAATRLSTDVMRGASWPRRGLNASVGFKTTKPDQNVWSRINAYCAGGRDGQLSGTYGLRAEELVQLMRAWQSAAMIKQGSHLRNFPAL